MLAARNALARGIALPRLRSQPGVLVAVVVSVLVATTLLATGPVLSTALAEAGLRARLEQAPPDEIGVEIEVRTRASTASAAADAAALAIGRTLGELVEVPDVLVRTGTVAIVGVDDDLSVTAGSFDTATASDDRGTPPPLLEGGDDPLDGAGAIGVLLHEGAQARLGVGEGDELVVEGGPTLRVVGTLTTPDPADPRWWEDPLWRDGVAVGSAFTDVGPVVPVTAGLAAVTGEADPRVTVTVRALPRVDVVRPEVLTELRARAGDVPREANRLLRDVVDSDGDRWTVEVPIATAAVDSTVQLGSTRASVLATVAQVAVLALYTLGLAGRLLRSGREVETMLVRARGATPGQLGVAALFEGIVVVVPVLAIAPWAAVAATRALGRLDVVTGAGLQLQPRVSTAAFVAAAVAAVACLSLLVWPTVTAARRTYASTRGEQGRRRAVTVVQSTGLDLALVVVAGIGVWQLRAAGGPVADGGAALGSVDVVLVSAPALGLLAGALLVLRVVPVLARIGERVVVGGRGLVASLSGWQVARRPDAVARPTLLLVLGVAIGVLVTTYATTWNVSQVDQAAAAVGAEAVATADRSAGALRPEATATTLEGVDGVASARPAIETPMRLPGGSRVGTLVAIDAADPVLLTRDDVAPTVPLTALDVPRLDGLPVAAGDTLRTVATLEPDPEWPGRSVTVAPLLRDGDGLVHRLEEGPPVTPSAPVELSWEVGALRSPVALLGVEVVTTSGADDGTGSVTVGPAGTTDPAVLADLASPSVDVLLSTPTVDGTAVAVRDVAWRADDPVQTGPALRPPAEATASATAEGIRVGAETGLAPAAGRQVTLRAVVAASLGVAPDAEPDVAPALVRPDVLDASGRAVGDVLEITVGNVRLPVEVVGTLAVVPGAVDAALPIVADLDALVTARWRQQRYASRADTWMLDVTGTAAGGEGGASLAASRTLAARLGGGEVRAPQVRTTVIDAAERSADPIAIGLVVALALGAVAAVLLALLGTVTAAAVGVRERAPEFALLQAVGTSMRQIRWWLASEVAVVVVTGLVAGGLLGAGLVWAVLPTLGLAADGTLAVPAPQVVVPVRTLALGALLVTATFALVPVGLARSVSRAHVAEVLRLGGEG